MWNILLVRPTTLLLPNETKRLGDKGIYICSDYYGWSVSTIILTHSKSFTSRGKSKITGFIKSFTRKGNSLSILVQYIWAQSWVVHTRKTVWKTYTIVRWRVTSGCATDRGRRNRDWNPIEWGSLTRKQTPGYSITRPSQPIPREHRPTTPSSGEEPIPPRRWSPDPRISLTTSTRSTWIFPLTYPRPSN